MYKSNGNKEIKKDTVRDDVHEHYCPSPLTLSTVVQYQTAVTDDC